MSTKRTPTGNGLTVIAALGGSDLAAVRDALRLADLHAAARAARNPDEVPETPPAQSPPRAAPHPTGEIQPSGTIRVPREPRH